MCLALTATSASEGASVDELLRQANALYEDLEFESMIAVAQEIISRPKVDVDSLLDSHILLGGALAVVGDREVGSAYRKAAHGAEGGCPAAEYQRTHTAAPSAVGDV